METSRPSKYRLKAAYRSVAILLGSIYLYSAIDHLINLERFFLSIHRYQIAGGSLANFTGLLLLVLMLSCGLGLIVTTRHALFGLMAFFVSVLLSLGLLTAWIRGIDVSCGCVIGDRKIDWVAVFKPISLAMASLFLTIGDSSCGKSTN